MNTNNEMQANLHQTAAAIASNVGWSPDRLEAHLAAVIDGRETLTQSVYADVHYNTADNDPVRLAIEAIAERDGIILPDESDDACELDEGLDDL